MLQMAVDVPTSACYCSTGEGTMLLLPGPATQPVESSPLYQWAAGPSFTLSCPPWCLYPSPCYKNSILLNDRIMEKQPVG